MRRQEPDVYIELQLGRLGILWRRRAVLTGADEHRSLWKLRHARANLPVELQLGIVGLVYRSG